MSINLDKTHFIIFHPYNKLLKKQITIKINKKAIKEQCFIKYLDVLIDSKLSWKHHVSKISKTISRSLGIMYKLQPFLPLKIMKNVYYSLIYSHLVYGIEVWGSACKTELNKLLVLQKRAMMLMTYNDQYPVIPGPLSQSNPIFIKLELLKIEEIFKYYISKFIFKCLQQLTPINFHS